MDMTAVYLFNRMQRVREVLLDDVSELIHKERAHALSASIPARARAKPGEYLGFKCVDGRFRLFAIGATELDDDTGQMLVTATDAAVEELQNTVVEAAMGTALTAVQAVRELIAGTGFVLGKTASGRTADLEAYYDYAWPKLEEAADAHDVRIVPYYVLSGNRISEKRIDVEKREAVFRGRIIEATDSAGGIVITRSGAPITRAYATGAATGTNDPPTRVTIADAVWSKASGNPADKPKGRTYVDNPDVKGNIVREMVFEDQSESDPTRLLEKTWAALVKRSAPKVSGTASAQDIEMIRGMAHKDVRRFDQIAVKAKMGETAMATVVDVVRNYGRPDYTRFEFGEEETAAERARRSIRAQVASNTQGVRRASGRGAAAMNNAIVNAALIQLNAEAIQLNARTIMAQAEQIELKADYSEMTELGEVVNNLGVDIDAVNADLLLYAKRTELGELKTEVYVDLNAIEDQVTIKANKVYVDAQITEVKTLIAEEIDAAWADFDAAVADAIYTKYISAVEGRFTNLYFRGYEAIRTTIPIVTSFTQALGEAATATEYTLLTVA